jgi:hypothetical protein
MSIWWPVLTQPARWNAAARHGQARRDVHGFRAAGVIEVEDVQGVRVVVAGPGRLGGRAGTR